MNQDTDPPQGSNKGAMSIQRPASRSGDPVSFSHCLVAPQTLNAPLAQHNKDGEADIQTGEEDDEMSDGELAEVEKELEAPLMDTDMVENDDLLEEDLDPEAEKIEAISQLSPMTRANPTPNLVLGEKMTHDEQPDKAKKGQTGTQKKPITASDVKGAMVSKKLQALRIWPSPKKRQGSGKSSNSHRAPVILPPHEVFPTAKEAKSSTVLGSVVSQKPPSKCI